MIGLAIAFALPAAAGWSIAARLAPERPAGALALAGRCALALLVGLCLSSLVPFLWLLAGGRLGGVYPVADALLFAALALGTRLVRPRRSGGALAREAPPPPAAPAAAADRLAPAFLLLAVLVAAAAFFRISAAAPHGDWDAWAIWNQRGRFLLRAGAGWRAAFAPELAWSHPGYPLLVPLGVARLWTYAGETTWAPAAFAAAFTLSAPAILASAAAASAGVLPGVVAGLLLLGTPGYLYWGSAQYADVPVAALFAAGLAVLLSTERAHEGRRGALVLGAFLLGMAAWTKNEGAIAAALAVAAFAATSVRARGRAAVARDLAPLAAGALLPAAAWVAFHAAVTLEILPPVPDGVRRLTVGERIADLGRWEQVLGALIRLGPGAFLGLPLLAVLLAVLLGLRRRRLLRTPALLAALALYGADVAIFVLTPMPLAWHLRTAAERVFLQPWPALLLGLFAATAD